MIVAQQQELFGEPDGPKLPAKVALCTRCAKRCRIADKVNPNANYFVKGDEKTGRFCAECLMVDFFKNFDLGPSSAMGKEYFDHSIQQPEWRKQVGDKDNRFDPEAFRLPHIQHQMFSIIQATQAMGGELTFEEIDWDEVIANWHLPFPEKKKPQKRNRKKPPQPPHSER